MIEDAPNVVTEEGLRGLLADGFLLEVVCKEGAEKRHNSWHGTWIIRAVTEDGRDDKILVTSRSYLRVREFKTIVGLVSFLADMGCTVASIPLVEAEHALHAAPGQSSAPRTRPVLVKDS
ncbi:hypothetical protein [Roseovarius sp.]|uniref:hypothetical protein n=1 Tax=Roseovarius sp. TaxID=1486281 RepID=UPI00356996BB